MKTANYNIRLDPAIKSKAEETFAVFGLNLSDAINVFLHTAILQRGFPFDLTYHEPNDKLLAAMKEADEIIQNPTKKWYATVEEMNAAMDSEDAAEADDV